MRDFALEVHFSRWELKARHHMTASDVQSFTLAELLDLASDDDRRAFENCWLGYTETRGAPDLRQAIAQTYTTLDAQHILCFAGAEEGIYATMRVLLSPGDHTIVITPNYQAAEGVPLRPELGWRIDLDELQQAVKASTKLVSINFPNNPTGAVLPREDFDALVGICRRHDPYLFSDEVYRLLEHDASLRLPAAADVYEKAFSLNVMSKSYGLPGLRIGWIAGRDIEALARFERYKHYLSICNSAPSELARQNRAARRRTHHRSQSKAGRRQPGQTRPLLQRLS